MPIRPVPVGDRLFQPRDQPGVEKRNTRQVIAAGTRTRASPWQGHGPADTSVWGDFPTEVSDRPTHYVRFLLQQLTTEFEGIRLSGPGVDPSTEGT